MNPNGGIICFHPKFSIDGKPLEKKRTVTMKLFSYLTFLCFHFEKYREV